MKKIFYFLFIIALFILFTLYFKDEKNSEHSHHINPSPITAENFLRTHFINVGQADATLLQAKEGDLLRTVLIDAGDWNRTDLLSYLEKEHIQTIDLIVITHPHADHIGQLDKIIQSFQVKEVWMNGELSNSQVFANALQAIDRHDVGYHEPKKGDHYQIGPLSITILHPDELSSNTNNNSIAMNIQYGDIAFLFTGDAERAAEEEMLNDPRSLVAQILHIGHHGSNTSTTGNFLEAVNPQTAIYSAGVQNAYGHPDEEIVERLKNRKIDIYGTDKDGSVIIETDGKTYHIMTENRDGLPVALAEKVCIDVNSAQLEDLQKIIHIGEKLAADIVASRPFSSVEQLIDINGIGKKKLADIIEQDLACIGG